MPVLRLHIFLFSILTLLLPRISAVCQDLSVGLIAHYPLDGDALDIGPFALNGTVVGTEPALDRDLLEYSGLLFDGIDDFVRLPNSSSFEIQFPLTVSIAIRLPLDDFPRNMGLFNTDNFSQNYFGLFLNTDEEGHFSLYYSFGLGCTCPSNWVSRRSSIPLTAATEQRLTAIIQENGEIDLYLNCEEVSGDYSGLMPNDNQKIEYSSEPGLIGTAAQLEDLKINRFHGIMDDFRLWDRALSEAEVQSLNIVEKDCDDKDCSNGLEYWDGCQCQKTEPITEIKCDDEVCSNGIEFWNNELCACDTIEVVLGCTDVTASNYNPLATCDDSSCRNDANAIYIPNIIYPNGPSPNNTFLIQGVNISKIEIMIYDRWGNQIFRSNDINKMWHGKFGNKQIVPGNYIYHITVSYIDQSTQMHQGQVTLVM